MIIPSNRYGDYLILYIPAGLFVFDSFAEKLELKRFMIFSFVVKIIIIGGFLQLSFNQAQKNLAREFEMKQGYISVIQTALQKEANVAEAGLEFLKTQRPVINLPYPDPVRLWALLSSDLKVYFPGSIKNLTDSSFADRLSSDKVLISNRFEFLAEFYSPTGIVLIGFGFVLLSLGFIPQRDLGQFKEH